MDDLLIRLSNGTSIYSPASLKSITTFVLLEQETWFEKEFSFLQHVITPGSTVIDIGANLGTYALAMARLVGPGGRVYAYEPTSSTRETLERSRDANGAANLTIIGKALSDGRRTGRIVFGNSSELNHLGDDGGEGEFVDISSLDIERELLGWQAPDFIKIDAEGEEIRILEGARTLLAETSPLLMLELKAASTVNVGLVDAVRALGYDAYRLLPGLPLLVPLGELGRADEFELNFFAAKPDRAAELQSRNLLVASRPAVAGDHDGRAMRELGAQPFASVFPQLFGADANIHPGYATALACYNAWGDDSRGMAERYAALEHGVQVLAELCESDGRIARLTTLARMASDLGRRGLAVSALQTLIDETREGGIRLGEPFWPASSRFDVPLHPDKPAAWFLAGVFDQFERLRHFSGSFGGLSATLPRLAASSFASAEMLRRKRLFDLKLGIDGSTPERLLIESEDNVNAELWRDGTVERLAAS